MLAWPDWAKLYAEGNCLYYGEPFSDEQWRILDNAKSEAERGELLRKMREEYMKNRDLATGELIKEPEVKEEVKEEVEEIEESIEDVKPSKPTKKKGK